MASANSNLPFVSQFPDSLRQLVKENTVLIQELDEAAFGLKIRPDKWSKKEILGHLIDSAQNNLRRFITAQYETSPPHIVYNQDLWVAANQYNQADKQNLTLLWKLLNERIASVIENMPAEKLGSLCNTGKEKEELHPISDIAADYLTHLQHHLVQLTT